MKSAVPVWMSLSAGYVDTAGFLALQGLFTAHVTGNFVTLGAALLLGGSGAVAKLLALPVFCAVIVGTRMFSHLLPMFGLPTLRTMLTLQVLLLIIGAVMAMQISTHAKGDDVVSVITGMFLVSAMAIQNAASRIHLVGAPPTTLMTGTTTQIMIDFADLITGLSPDAKVAVVGRMSGMAANVAGFALGCASGAVLYGQLGMWCFAVAPVLAAVPVFMIATKDPA